MKKSIVSLIIFSVFSISLIAQEINQLDSQGRKQGPWKKYYPSNDALFYEGQFKDDKPYGVFKNYYESGELKSTANYQGDNVKSRVYYPKGQLMAEGNFIDQKKDSIWNYYNEEGWISLKENYVKGMKEGKSFSYYPDGTVAMMTTYLGDVENGPFLQSYPDGKTESEGVFMGGNYNGDYTYYFDNGKKLHTGEYINGKRNGLWIIYNENGSVRTFMHYKNGIVAKEEPQNGEFITYYDSGIPKSIYNYKKGKLDGPFVEYYDKGERVIVPREKDNSYEPDEFEEVLEGQQVKREGKYLEGALVGIEVLYDIDGKQRKKSDHSK